jgi:hypothetical protein
LIGVIPKANQTTVVEEFFELFKTPWEFYRPGKSYDVLVVTADEIPETDAKLVLIYGVTATTADAPLGITVKERYAQALVNNQPSSLPIYSGVTTLATKGRGTICLTTDAGTAGVRFELSGSVLIRIGYDLFEEARLLLSAGQPVAYAHCPTLDLHIRLLREWILGAGIPLLEMPPVPVGHSFTVCLTHDIDFVSIRNHKFDHTMWGFLYRSIVGSVLKLFRRRISLGRLLQTWRAAASLPFVYLGLAKDFWEPFQWFLELERGLGTTYFLIPFKGRAGEHVPGRHASRRAASYDLRDLSSSIAKLKAAGCQLGVHGIDAWHSVGKGRAERERVEQVSGACCSGIRMHWLLRDENTVPVLEESGYAYDSTVGYNETIGYKAGTTQVFRPIGAQRLLELPVHVQDGALFYPNRMDLAEAEAEKRCRVLIQNAKEFGGVLTLIWHDRSHGPERFWGDFYVRLVHELKSCNPYFATATQAVDWTRKRRRARFETFEDRRRVRLKLDAQDRESLPLLTLRVHRPVSEKADAQHCQGGSTFTDIPWDGEGAIEFDSTLHSASCVCTSRRVVSSIGSP